MLEQFKTLMREHFPDYDLSMKECDDERFLDIEVNAMWMIFQICNAWEPIKTIPEEGDFLVYLPDEREGRRILVANYHKNVKIIGGLFAFDRKAKPTDWRPLPIPPLTTEGGV